jgi:hypothetical protein
LKIELRILNLDNFLADLNGAGIVVPDGSTLLLIRNDYYGTGQTIDKSRLEYHILTGQFTVDQLPIGTDIPTLNGATQRIYKYGNDYFVNGFAQIDVVDSNIQIGGSSIAHIINTYLPLPLPGDDLTSPEYLYRADTVKQALYNVTTVTDFLPVIVDYLDEYDNFTIILPENSDIDDRKTVFEYLLNNATARDEYLSNIIFDGLWFPASAYPTDFITIQARSGMNYTLSYTVNNNELDAKVSFTTDFNQDIGGSEAVFPNPRSNGIFYVVQTKLFNVVIPPPPPPEIAPPKGPSPGGVLPPSSAVGLQISFLFVLLGSFVMFLFQ